MTSIQRQEELLESYGFQCTCPACQLDTAFGIESQQRRIQMQNLAGRIEENEDDEDATQRPQRNQLLADIQAFALLLQQEGLFYPQLADSFGQLVLWYRTEKENAANGAESAAYQAGLIGEALQAARAKLDWDVICTGHASPTVKETLKLICELGQE